MNKLDIIMAGFGVDKELNDTSKDISEEAEHKAKDIKVRKAKIEEINLNNNDDDDDDINNEDINDVIEED